MSEPASNPEEVKKHLTDICQRVIDDNKWGPFDDYEITILEEGFFGAAIRFDERRIMILAPKGIYGTIDSMIEKERLRLDRETVLNHIMDFAIPHEHGHHKIAPISKENHEAIINSIYGFIEKREVRAEDILQKSAHIANMFTDTLDNTVNSLSGQKNYTSGFDLLYMMVYHHQGILSGKKINKPRVDKAMTLFYNSNHHLAQTDTEMNAKMQKYMARVFPARARCMRQLVDIFTSGDEMTRRVIEHKTTLEDNLYIKDRMTDSTLWPEMAEEYTRIVYPLIRKIDDSIDNQYTRKQRKSENSQPNKKGKEGKGGQGNDSKKNKQQNKGEQGGGSKEDKKKKKEAGGDKNEDKGGGDEEKDKKSGEEQDGKQEDRQYQPRYTIDRLKKDLKKLAEGAVMPKHEPYSSPFLARFREIDKLYKDRAGRFALLGEQPREESRQAPRYLSTEEMPVTEFNSKQVDWASSRMMERNDGSAHIQLYKKSLPYFLPFEDAPSPISIPDISFVVDSSCSMGFDPFAGEGEYHLAVLAFYSILNYLEQENIAPFVRFNAINFSATEATCSGWCDYSDIKQVKRALFDYHGLGTYLDPGSLKELFNSRKDNFISLWLSDTGFNTTINENAILKEVQRMHESQGVGFFFFVLGPQTSFSKSLENMGLSVKYIKSAEEFLKGSLKISKDLYASCGVGSL